ncbi:MAG: hydroxylamine reductase [Calditrichia bacterium]|nr:hydroxylamine reductase [Calditrichia bacterium]
MFCNQCQEALNNEGCTIRGVCGIQSSTVELQDLLIYITRGISYWTQKAGEYGIKDAETDMFVAEALFTTITNVNFDDDRMVSTIERALSIRNKMKKQFLEAYKEKNGTDFKNEELPESALWSSDGSLEEMRGKGSELEALIDKNEDLKSLKKLLLYGIKGISAYADHAAILKHKSQEIFDFLHEAMNAIGNQNQTADNLVNLINKCGKISVDAMALLDEANVTTFGTPEVTEVYTGTERTSAILVSGHDLLDLHELLEQTKGTGVKIYTHGEMLPAHSYPELKKYDHLIGNYGGAWYAQKTEFEEFGGAILMTTNCIQKPKKSYHDKIFTTGLVAFEDVAHIPNRTDGKPKDFTPIIEKAKEIGAIPVIKGKKITIGFNHRTLLTFADKIIDAVKTGAIKKFVVMGGCDGRHKEREYYTEFAKEMPMDTAILTAGCAKFRYNNLDLGDINGIPRVIDAGQCNDSYSLAVTALKLQEVFGLEDINDLPIVYNIAWYEQKAVTVLLALLYLGVKGIKLGPTLPAFITPGILKVLVDTFGINPITSVKEDIKAMLS